MTRETIISIPLEATYIQTSKGIKKAKATGKEPKPTYWRPNFQSLYNASLNPRMRGLMVKSLGEVIKPYILASVESSTLVSPIVGEKVSVRLEVYIERSKAKMDIFNYCLYLKIVEDLLVKLGVIPNDNKDWIEEAGHCKYVWSEDRGNEAMLRFIITIGK